MNALAVGLVTNEWGRFASWIDAKCIRSNDFYRADLLLSVAIQILDSVTDVFLAWVIASGIPNMYHTTYFYIFTGIISVMVVSFIISMIQLNHMINKHWSKSQEMRSWLSKWSHALYIFSSLFGRPMLDIDVDCKWRTMACKPQHHFPELDECDAEDPLGPGLKYFLIPSMNPPWLFALEFLEYRQTCIQYSSCAW